MKFKLSLGLALVLIGGLIGCATHVQHHPVAVGAEISQGLTKQISGVLIQCQKIKLGMTRAELLQVFGREGGISQAEHRTFVYRQCPLVKIAVGFKLSSSTQKLTDEEQPTDTISEISKPYLDWGVLD